jgi:transposase-like protein
MSYRELSFDSHNVAFSMSEVKDMFRMHFERGNRHVTQRVYQKILAVDFASYLEAKPYERTSQRRGQRNGYRGRTLVTSAGVLQLRVPRDRAGGFRPSLFVRYRRFEPSLEEAIRQLFISGVSTRKVGAVLDALCGSRVSASKVSSVLKELNQAVHDFANAPIADDISFLFLDAVSVSVKFGLKARKVKLLVAYGIHADGRREILSFQRAHSESKACWQAFLENLQVRGLRGRQLRLITMDGGKGLWSAVEDVYPLIPRQLCWVHKLRNVAKHCRIRDRQQCTREAAQIMYADSTELACRTFRAWRQRWQKPAPKAVACLQNDFDRLIPIFTFPQCLRKTIRTTNVIERSFREVRRRLKVMGYFQNSASCDRVVYALFMSFNNKWQRRVHRIDHVADLKTKAA